MSAPQPPVPTAAASGARADLLDPAVLSALGGLEIIARWVVDGFITGLHRSPRRGFSVEFAEHRPYQPGDDLRYLDWKIAARADRWVVKQFEEETNLRATLVLDVSRSMNWTGAPGGTGRGLGEARLTKLAYAERLIAAIALLLLRQRDAVGLIRFDADVRTVVPPRSRTGQFRRLLASLAEPGAGEASKAGEALERAARLVRRAGMVLLVSDLLVEPEEVERAMRALRAAGHDITVLHVLDPAERDLSLATGEAVFLDPETKLAVPAAVADVRDAYRSTVDAAIAQWRSTFGRLGVRYTTVLTDTPFGVPLRHAFASRAQLP
jgi:uncharacterized protein (DUF58 family)